MFSYHNFWNMLLCGWSWTRFISNFSARNQGNVTIWTPVRHLPRPCTSLLVRRAKIFRKMYIPPKSPFHVWCSRLKEPFLFCEKAQRGGFFNIKCNPRDSNIEPICFTREINYVLDCEWNHFSRHLSWRRALCSVHLANTWERVLKIRDISTVYVLYRVFLKGSS